MTMQRLLEAGAARSEDQPVVGGLEPQRMGRCEAVGGNLALYPGDAYRASLISRHAAWPSSRLCDVYPADMCFGSAER